MSNNKKPLELEGEDSLNPSLRDIYPDAVVKISRDQYSAFEIKRMVEETKELQLDPDFQRNEVWNTSQKRELIESLLMGIPIPVIYVFENEQGIKQLVDGRQRISTIISFMNNKFALNDLDLLSRFNGFKFKDLEPIYQSKLERYQLFVYVIEPPTPEVIKYDIFDRVNRGGTQLNNQEMRNALYYGPSTKLLKELSETQEFKQATGNAIKSKRMRDRYIILRFIAFYLWRQGITPIEYRSNLDDFLAETMRWLNKDSNAELINRLIGVFKQAMNNCYEILGSDAFRFPVNNQNRRPINMALFESLGYFFATANIENISPDQLSTNLKELINEFDSSEQFSGRVDTSSSVEYRFNKIEELRGNLQC